MSTPSDNDSTLGNNAPATRARGASHTVINTVPATTHERGSSADTTAAEEKNSAYVIHRNGLAMLNTLNSTWPRTELSRSTTVREPTDIELIRQSFSEDPLSIVPTSSLMSLTPVTSTYQKEQMSFQKEDKDPIFKVFCFPHAGGGAHSFQPWETRALALGMELVRLEYPGMQPNSNIKLRASSIQELASQLLPKIVEELDRAFIFFGHSMGGVVAYEVSRLMSERELPQPGGIIISSVPPPNYPPQTITLSKLDDPEFVSEAYKCGWFPKEALHNQELQKIMLPNLRRDIQLYEQYTHSFQEYGNSKSETWYLDHHLQTGKE